MIHLSSSRASLLRCLVANDAGSRAKRLASGINVGDDSESFLDAVIAGDRRVRDVACVRRSR
jgi:hypothetical protein